MKAICAWCKKHLRGLASEPLVSHGICRRCDRTVLDELEYLWLDIGGEG